MSKKAPIARDRDGAEIRRGDAVSLPTRRTARVINRTKQAGWLMMVDIQGIAIELPSRLVRKVADAA